MKPSAAVGPEPNAVAERSARGRRPTPAGISSGTARACAAIHGQEESRVVHAHGLSTFTALQRKGIPGKLLIFPDENHRVLKPANSLQWHDTVLGWLAEWLKK